MIKLCGRCEEALYKEGRKGEPELSCILIEVKTTHFAL